MEIKKYYTVADIAKEANVTPTSVRNWIYSGKLKTVNENTYRLQYMVTRDEWLYFKRVKLPEIMKRRRGGRGRKE